MAKIAILSKLSGFEKSKYIVRLVFREIKISNLSFLSL